MVVFIINDLSLNIIYFYLCAFVIFKTNIFPCFSSLLFSSLLFSSLL